MRSDPTDCFDDLPSLSVSPAKVVSITAAAASKRWQRRYVQVPWSWVEALREIDRACTYRLALEILYTAWKRSDGRPIVVSIAFAELANVGKRSRWRALADLERLGLVKVERTTGRSPKVTLCRR